MLPFGCSHSSPMAFSSVVSVNHPLDLIPLDLSMFVLLPDWDLRHSTHR